MLPAGRYYALAASDTIITHVSHSQEEGNGIIISII